MIDDRPPLDLWEHIPASARERLNDIVRLLAHRFTGEIVLRCNQGGVREMCETRVRRGGDQNIAP